LLHAAGSGDVTDIGIGKGKYYAVNVPLKDGINDQTYISVFTRFWLRQLDSHDWDAVLRELQ